MSGQLSEKKARVRRYWEAEPCGSKLATAEPGTKEFYDEIERTRYELEPFIPGFADVERWRGRDVLEVGVGLGTDFIQFARAGARLSGVDLTEASVDLARRRLELDSLAADLRVADAESLPFSDSNFDLVYSWGVLHHTPDTERALNEVRRVLRPGGEARIMLYSRRSWVSLGVWLRYGLGRGRPWHSMTDLLSHHMESPGTKAYTEKELERLFRGFSTVRFQRFVTPYDRRVGGPLADILGSRLGWFVGVVATP
jgi:ubiquinone/menaquinone biosynthesis C-methylase UbiE